MLLRDPVHGDIYLSEIEVRVLDTKEMQRLRGIKQLGTAHLVFPGCVHTRFDHSLGCLQMAHRMLESLRLQGYTIHPDDAQLVRLAMLVHDVTHIPYGHTFEDERQIFPRHDAGPRLEYFLGPRSELGRVLAEAGVLDGVKGILTGHPPVPWMGQVVSSTIDADLLDYLRRDSFFAGLRMNFDDRIFSYFYLEEGKLLVNMVKHGLDRPDARTEIIHLLRMRYVLTERIYLHHAKIASGAMISKAVELHAKGALRGEEALYDLGDQTFMDLMARLPGPGVIQQLIEGVASRRLYKRAYVLSLYSLGENRDGFIRRYAGQSAEREELENQIAAKARLKPGQVILYCPKASFFKEVRVPVKSRIGVGPLYEVDSSGEVAAMARQYEGLWRTYVFCPPEKVDAVRRACEKLFEYPSELTPHT
ncbi:MAG: HD domain-containing protein [Bacillota bacterium]